MQRADTEREGVDGGGRGGTTPAAPNAQTPGGPSDAHLVWATIAAMLAGGAVLLLRVAL